MYVYQIGCFFDIFDGWRPKLKILPLRAELSYVNFPENRQHVIHVFGSHVTSMHRIKALSPQFDFDFAT